MENSTVDGTNITTDPVIVIDHIDIDAMVAGN